MRSISGGALQFENFFHHATAFEMLQPAYALGCDHALQIVEIAADRFLVEVPIGPRVLAEMPGQMSGKPHQIPVEPFLGQAVKGRGLLQQVVEVGEAAQLRLL